MKYVGLFLIFVCCTTGGMILAGSYSRSLSLCEAMLQFVRHIRNQVSYYKTSVGEICTSFHSEAFERCGMDQMLAEKGFPATLQEKEGALSLEEDAFRALTAFANRLGSLPYDEQIMDCDYIAETLERAIAAKREGLSAKRQIYSSMGLLFGAMAVLILL